MGPPYITCIDNYANDDSQEERPLYLKCFRNELCSAPWDIPRRFTAFGYYYQRAILPPLYKEEWEEDWPTRPVRHAFFADLRELVRLRTVEECPKEWRIIKWEIQNCYAARDWDRAARLYAYAEFAADRPATLPVLRAQFAFLSVFHPHDIDSVNFQALEDYSESVDRKDDEVLTAPHWRIEVLDLDATILEFQAGMEREPALPSPESPEQKRTPSRRLRAAARAVEEVVDGASVIYKAALLTRESAEAKHTALERARILDVKQALEKASEEALPLRAVHVAMLARSSFALGDYDAAGRNYELLRSSDTVLSRPIDPPALSQLISLYCRGLLSKEEFDSRERITEDFGPRIFYSAALSWRRAGHTQKTLEILELWSEKYPDGEPLRLMADVQAEACNYKAAYDYLQKLVELRPELHEDVATKIALVFGALQDSDNSLDQAAKFLDSNPWLAFFIDSMEKVHWSCFSELSDQSRSEWRAELCEMYLFASIVPQDRARRYENAVKHFAKVAELEVRTRVFEKYRKEVPADKQSLGLPWPGRDGGRTNLYDFLFNKRSLNLDKIIGIFEGLADSQDPVAKPFHAWLQQRNDRLLGKIEVLKKIRKERGDATHKEIASSLALAEGVAQRCREVLNSFVPARP